MNATLINEILSSGNKVLSTLNEAKETLSSAECWGNKEDVTCSHHLNLRF